MNREKLKEIFIEEATEIINNLDVQIINFEENPRDKELLNEIFRGVHTLKGSANSFGFGRLGKFVHSFEDLLDHYRSSNDEISHHVIDVFLESVDVTKEVFTLEMENNSDLPENYQKCLNDIQSLLNGEEETIKPKANLKDLSSEFGEFESSENSTFDLKDRENLLKIELTCDDDIYFRGYDHTIFLNLLAELGRVLDSSWDLSKVPNLSNLDTQKSYISKIIIHFATTKDIREIEEVFEFLEMSEYSVEAIDKSKEIAVEEVVINPTIHKEEPKKEVVETHQLDREEENESKSEKKATQNDEKKSFVKIDTKKLDELFDSVGELVIAQNFLAENSAIRALEDVNVNKTIETLSKITRLIQNRVMSLRMVPIRDTFDRMKRVVRDVAKKLNKEVKLTIYGEDTEIDKNMVDALNDPLIHIIRNAMDHGIESDFNDRVKAGKEKDGNIILRAFHKGGNIAIEVSDDGRGINRDKVLKKAIERGLVDADKELSDQQIFSLIMQAGFSTADKISDVSGRGVGLDVVRTSVETLRGKIEIDSKLGKGSKFTILLPLTLAIIDGMIVRSGSEILIIPTLSIVESFRPSEAICHTVQGKGEFVNLREELMPVVRLNIALELDDKRPNIWESTLVCAENEKGRFAILVDELIGRQQVVIKPLGKSLAKLKEISGGAVMGNGEIALILNVEELY